MANITPTLETKRLILRPVTLDDAQAAQALFNNWEVVKYMFGAIPWPYPDNGTHEYYAEVVIPKMESGQGLSWAIIEKASPNFIGLLELTPKDETDNRGFWIGQPYWRQGYITEAIVATTDYAFDVLKMPLMRLNNAVPNLGSRRVKEKAGATLVNTVEGDFVAGKFPKEIWELTPEQWRASPMKLAAASPSYRILSR